MKLSKLKASCPDVGQEWRAKHSTLLDLFARFLILHFSRILFFSISEKYLNMQVSVRGKKLLILSKEKLPFDICNNFENFGISTKFRKNAWTKLFSHFAKIPLCFAELMIIWMNIIRVIYCLQNDYEQIYSFVDISIWKSCRLTQMSADLRNCNFSTISEPEVECFAPFFRFSKISQNEIFKKSVRPT